MPNATLSTQLLRNALNELRQEADRLAAESGRQGKLNQRLRASLALINNEAWKLHETVDQIERDLNTEGESCTL